MKLTQRVKTYLGLPGIPEVFEKYLEALENILKLVQLKRNHLGPPGVFEKYLEALAIILELVQL